jgi:hypothetical protein
VHPEDSVLRRRGEACLGEELVDVGVLVPPPPLQDGPVGEAVEERPEGAVGEAVVVGVDLVPP